MAEGSQFRDLAANERTVLAWIRTGIALMAFGFAIARFGLFLREMSQAGAGAAPSRVEHAMGHGVFCAMRQVTPYGSSITKSRMRHGCWWMPLIFTP